ncbi:MAG: hypothetical protein AB7F75_02065 [Planctomycetota bacterium]
MALSHATLQILQSRPSTEAWKTIFDLAWEICSKPIPDGKPDAEIPRRDRAVGDIDLFMATAGWDLWRSYENDVPRTSEALASWWQAQSEGRAVLILDALSLREVPWILRGAEKRGYKVDKACATGAELPADTTSFAKALGFGQRSALGNNGAGGSHKLTGARTESVDIAWKDSADLVGSEPRWVFWHHWPDHRLHDHDDPGKGLSTLTREVEENLGGDDFWKLVDRLLTGRRLVITADHGYAASGLFPDSNKEQTDHLKAVFRSGRMVPSGDGPGEWVPPIDISMETRHGKYLFVLGRRKWKSAGGYPTLTHGGLSVLEVAVPWIEITRGTQS